MAELVVYGASDDLIEIEGDITEEFYSSGGGNVVVITNKEVVEIKAELEIDWTASAKVRRGTPRIELIPRPNRPEGTDDMAVKLTLDGDDPLVYYIGDNE